MVCKYYMGKYSVLVVVYEHIYLLQSNLVDSYATIARGSHGKRLPFSPLSLCLSVSYRRRTYIIYDIGTVRVTTPMSDVARAARLYRCGGGPRVLTVPTTETRFFLSPAII